MPINKYKKILCIRLDNFGDVIMTTPAIRALKENFTGAQITLLTSKMGSVITPFIPLIDKTIVFTPPWVKTKAANKPESIVYLAKDLKKKKYDLGVIFSNFSQNPLPSAMLAYLAEIPDRLAYCRENPYELINLWVPDQEPFDKIIHGVKRQINLVKTVGATAHNQKMQTVVKKNDIRSLEGKLKNEGLDEADKFIVIHAGVSEEKRKYPEDKLADAVKLILHETKLKAVLTGTKGQASVLSQKLKDVKDVISLIGKTTMGELIALISKTQLLISNNTGPVHISAALNTPVLDLYSTTNPEHTPWMVKNKVIYFDPAKKLISKNTILKYAAFRGRVKMPQSRDILKKAIELL